MALFRVFCVGSEILVEKLPESKLMETELLETVKFSFNVESLGLTLYSNDPIQVGIIKPTNGEHWCFLQLQSIDKESEHFIPLSLSIFLSLALITSGAVVFR